ncbi:MAG: iron-containing alcohol dehydrogenase, partial [Clostridia bacterium]|nr:iron-containing alcohol dehydrogenase [Clostridia bacterium]
MRKFFEFQNAAKINCGEAALSTVGKELSYLGAKKPLVLLSANAVKLGVKAKILNTLAGCDLKGVAVAEPVPAEVNLDYARGQKKLYLKEKCDALIAVGG